MTMISLIAAIDKLGGLGFNNQLLAHLPADLAHFKSITMGKPIIMGRKTYESIGRPLPGRQNIIISTRLESQQKIIIVPTIEQALLCTGDATEVMIIGGAQLFQQSMNLASRMYLTIIDHQFEADVHFPLIDMNVWQCCEEVVRLHDEHNKYDMRFCTFERITGNCY